MRFRFRTIALPIAVLALLVEYASGQKSRSFDPEDEASCNKVVGSRDDSSASGVRGWIYGCGQADIAIEKREFAALIKAESASPESEKHAYKALLAGFEKYRGLLLPILAKECGSGVGCGAEMSVEEAAVNYGFLITAQGFRLAGFRQSTENEYADADAKLNESYKKLVASSPANCEGSDLGENCVSQQELRTMERAWVIYRDAWVIYGAIKWPDVPANTFRALITQQQVKWLSQP